MTSCGASVGTDVHPFAADRAEDWSAGEPVFFSPWLQNHSPGDPFVAILDFFSSSLPALPPRFLKHSKLFSFTCKFCYVFSSLCVAVFSYQRTSYTALPFLWDLPSLLTDFYPLFLPSIPVRLQAVLSLRKEKPDTVWDPKLGMSLTWLSFLLVKLQ